MTKAPAHKQKLELCLVITVLADLLIQRCLNKLKRMERLSISPIAVSVWMLLLSGGIAWGYLSHRASPFRNADFHKTLPLVATVQAEQESKLNEGPVDFDKLDADLEDECALNPEALMRSAGRPNAHQKALLRAAFKAWIKQNPGEAVRWALANRSKDLVNDGNIFQLLGQTSDVADAHSALELIDHKELKLSLLRDFIAAVPNAHSSLMGWVGAVDPDERILFQRAIVSDWAHTDPQSALNWAVSQSSDPETAGAILSSFADGWLEAAPQDALKWLNAQPQTTQFDSARSIAASRLAATDPEASLSLISEIGDTHTRTLATIRPAMTLMRTDPEMALDFLSAIPDPSIRENRMEYAMENWAVKDPDAVLAYLQQTDLSEPIKAQVISKISVLKQTH